MRRTSESFSEDYAEARSKFLEAASTGGGFLESLNHPAKGPTGADLFVDVAWFGPRAAERALVLISATHGAEGFCGSGAQIDLLRRGEIAALPKDMGLLMIHAVNPYGFAWLRRVTHENVDLNRNWIDFSKPLPANPGYAALSGAFCPSDWSEGARKNANKVLREFGEREGAAALQAAASAGQYQYPLGIFYGGTQPSWSRNAQTRILEHYLGGVSNVAIIDYHTGLGPWGYAEQIVPFPRESAAFQRAASWYGAAITSTLDGSSTSADVVGDGIAAASSLLRQSEVTGMALEVGTLPMNQVMMALRADAWLHAFGDPASPQGAAIKKQIREAFYGDTDDWKGMVAGQSLLAFKQAIRGLERTKIPTSQR